jgi:hypothetical protein
MKEHDSMPSIALRALALTFAVWLAFSWPLPLHLFSAIPGACTSLPASTAMQPMQPGDHLQLEYHFWLFGDMLTGHTPWFYNLYEFNTGDDAQRREPGGYYLPFSFFHTVGSWIGGRAFGWNFSGFISLWLTAWFTFMLVRRYTEHRAAAWLAAAVALAVPYRWINIFGGSPTGFGMAFVPLVLYGIDLAVRDEKIGGGILAGVALLFAGWSDPHTFFFCALATPFWCVFAFLRRDPAAWSDVRRYVRMASALWPVALFAALAYLSNKTNTRHVGESRTGVRTFSEIALFTPQPEGVFNWSQQGISEHVYLGVAVAALAIAGIVLSLRNRRTLGLLLMLAAALFVLVELALGPNGLHGGYFFRLARRLIPPYGMIRQPAKVFCLVPTLLALTAALGVSAFRAPRTAAWIFGGLLLLDWRMHVQPILTRLDREQPAYAAIAAASDQPRALAVPLWPGDSHFSSVYQRAASLYRIRMLNGYRPYVSTNYTAVVESLDSIDAGVLTDAQLDDLQARGIRFIVFHENLFPEKVSPFPAGFTLRQLLTHPRLTLLKRDGAVWAFQVADAAPAAATLHGSQDDPWAPARRVEWERTTNDVERIADASASDRQCVRLAAGARLQARSTKSPSTPGLHWLVRARGKGILETATADISTRSAVDSASWVWIECPLPEHDGLRDVTPTVTCTEGSIDVDTALLLAAPWRAPSPGDQRSIPAERFFHGGVSDPETGAVAFTPVSNGPGLVFNGPRLPLEPGRYRITFDIASPAPSGTELGTIYLRHEGGPDLQQTPLLASASNRIVQTVRDNLPFMATLAYNGTHEMQIRRVIFERLPPVR